ncbi:hypothetical protein PHMEG_00040606, partial [Phytophthora megakarya]
HLKASLWLNQVPNAAPWTHEEAEDPTRQYGEDSATKSKSSKKKLKSSLTLHGKSQTRTHEEARSSVARTIRIKKKVDEFAFELELPDKRGYRFYPVVHISRLKPVNEFSSRPTTLLAPEVAQYSRMDFDEALLPEDAWEPDHIAGEYELEVILDDRRPLQPVPRSRGLLYDYLQRKKSEHRFQMVQVADEN